jgi:Zn finger protein HypA/HybF involved in hydrogenase expression
MPGMPVLKATTWTQLVDEFLADRRAQGLKDRSLEFYQYGLERFLLWAAESGVVPADFEARHLRAFLAWLQMTGNRARDRRKGQRLAPRTLHAYSRVVRALLYFGGREGMLEAVPVMQMPRLPRPDPEYLREDEIERLRQACRDPRDRVLIELMLDTGLRRGEVCRLTWGDLTPDAALVRVRVRHGKGTCVLSSGVLSVCFHVFDESRSSPSEQFDNNVQCTGASCSGCGSATSRVSGSRSFFMDSWLKYRRPTCHSSEVSIRTAPTSRITEAPSGKMPTTLVRRLTSLFSLSRGLVE